MNDVLFLVRCKLRKYQFRLLWNGSAMLSWRSTELDMGNVSTKDLPTTAKMLWILANEAAAWCRTYGYEPDNVPSEEELLAYLTGIDIMPWEFKEVMRTIAVAINYGEHQDYKPPESEELDIDTIELKKN